MSDICSKCKNVVEPDKGIINCSGPECLNIFHRKCVDIVDDKVSEAIENNPFLSFYCVQCNFMQMLESKLATMEEQMNKLNNCLNAWNARHLQQSNGLDTNHSRKTYAGANNNNNNNNNSNNNNFIVIGSNTNLHRLNVVCDYGRWVQVGKFATSTSEEEIIEHLSSEVKINKSLIKCTKLVKNDANLANLQYCKFKISIPDYRFNELFNEAIWPCGVMGKKTQRLKTLHTTETTTARTAINFKKLNNNHKSVVNEAEGVMSYNKVGNSRAANDERQVVVVEDEEEDEEEEECEDGEDEDKFYELEDIEKELI